MKADVELSLIHDGAQWVGYNGALAARGDTLEALDHDVRRALQTTGDYPAGTKVTVFMAFDFETIPIWLRQYHAHYFNRYVAIDL